MRSPLFTGIVALLAIPYLVVVGIARLLYEVWRDANALRRGRA